MKNLLAVFLICCTFSTASFGAGESPKAAPTVVTGVVLEVKDVEVYTYLRLKTKDGETWAAVNKATVKKGSTVSIENAMVMNNFESTSLKKTFPSIVFGNLAGTAKAGGQDPHGAAAKVVDTGPIKVDKAKGANARTVADIVTKAADLKDKPVQVRGKVVKYSAEIMGKNWIHLRDGSGSEANNSNDILVTTGSPAKVGDVLTVSGTVRIDKDFGSGYAYKVLIEDATLQP
jgi:hypothetical protein